MYKLNWCDQNNVPDLWIFQISKCLVHKRQNYIANTAAIFLYDVYMYKTLHAKNNNHLPKAFCMIVIAPLRLLCQSSHPIRNSFPMSAIIGFSITTPVPEPGNFRMYNNFSIFTPATTTGKRSEFTPSGSRRSLPSKFATSGVLELYVGLSRKVLLIYDVINN